MIRSRQDRFPGNLQRRGYTLLELLLVAAIILVLTGIAWPAVTRMMSSQSLQNDADMVRRVLGSVRATAIDQGMVYQFRYEPEGRRFIVIPWDRPDANGGGTGGSNGVGGGVTGTATSVGSLPLRTEIFTLGENCTFAAGGGQGSLATSSFPAIKPPTATATGSTGSSAPKPGAMSTTGASGRTERLPEMWAALLPGIADVNWSEAIRVFPDGQADAVSITVQDRKGRSQVVSIRGLTGMVTVQPVTTGGARQ